ncbi:MAG: MgtC/SapB family protein [Candidatus Acidiferrales bacterium]
MLQALNSLVPSQGVEILLVVFLSFLIGLEREEGRGVADRYRFGGVRTFPLIGLIGYAMGLLAGQGWGLIAAGFAVVGAFLWLSYWHKLQTQTVAGVTTEISGLTTYLVGVLISRDHFWVATTLAILGLLLLELKQFLESLTDRIAATEILTFTKFLLLTFVILPILPNREFGAYHLNPFKAWMVVVAVSGLSYGGYILQKLTHGKGGVMLAALLGGAYSSTLTTIVLSKRARVAPAPHLYSGAILLASGVMYLRFLVLVWLFNHALAQLIALPFAILTFVGMVGGWMWARRPDSGAVSGQGGVTSKNPLELSVAFTFAVIFVGVLVLTQFTLTYLGRGGIFALATVMGISDVEPFVMGLTQAAGQSAPLHLAAASIVVAAASNNLAKGFFALGLADRKTGRESLALLIGLTLAGLLPLLASGLR